MSHPKTEFQTISSLFPSFSLRSGKQDQGDTRTSFSSQSGDRWSWASSHLCHLTGMMAGGVELLCYHESSRFAQNEHCINLNKSVSQCVLIGLYKTTEEHIKLHAVQMKPPHFTELLMVPFIKTLYYFTKLPYLLSCNAMLTNCNSPHSKASHWNPWILFLSISYYSNSLLSTRIHKYYYQESLPLC